MITITGKLLPGEEIVATAAVCLYARLPTGKLRVVGLIGVEPIQLPSDLIEEAIKLSDQIDQAVKLLQP